MNCSPEDATPPIAIVGMAGRFPGEATDPDKLWKLCAQGRDAWSPIPSTRFNAEAFYHPEGGRNGFVSSLLSRYKPLVARGVKGALTTLDQRPRRLLPEGRPSPLRCAFLRHDQVRSGCMELPTFDRPDSSLLMLCH